jgi:hypothetical protein
MKRCEKCMNKNQVFLFKKSLLCETCLSDIFTHNYRYFWDLNLCHNLITEKEG